MELNLVHWFVHQLRSNLWTVLAILTGLICSLLWRTSGRSVFRPERYRPDFFSNVTMTETELYLGVYHEIHPEIYDKIYPSEPDPRIKEIAALMIEWYELYIDMGYISRKDVAFPPHENPSIDIIQAAKYGFTKDVVDLLQMLPYYGAYPNWNFGTDQGEFLMWGGFIADMRGDDVDWEHSMIDPFYATPDNDDGQGWDDPNGPYMKPWFVPLTDCGNHGSIMVLDTQTCEIWLVEQLGGSSDPALKDTHGSVDDPTNRNELNQYPCRPAVEFLRDMLSRFRSLDWIPGGLYYREEPEYQKFKKIYESAGWPDNFSLALFEDLRQKQDDADFALHTSFEPIERLNSVVRTMRWQENVKWTVKAIESKLGLEKDISEAAKGVLMERRTWYEGQLQTRTEWEDRQARIKVDLEEVKAEYELLKTCSGRFSGLTEDEYTALAEHDHFPRHIRENEELLADKDFEAREDRMLLEARTTAAGVSEETWAAFASKLEHEDQGNTTDSWLELDDLKSIIREDLSGDAVRHLILKAIKQRKEVDFWAS